MRPSPKFARRRRSQGQSLVEFAIILPVLALMVGGIYTVWTGLNQDIALTSAARAGVIEAVRTLNTAIAASGGHSPGHPSNGDLCNALIAAQKGIAAEEGISTPSVHVNDTSNWCGAASTCPASSTTPCLTMAYSNPGINLDTNTPVQQVYYAATITITEKIQARVPMVSGLTVKATAAEATK